MIARKHIACAVSASGALFVSSAAADPQELLTDYGLTLTAGGGVGGFTEEDIRDNTEIGGQWEVRAAFGTHAPIGIEAAYVGSAQSIDAIGLDSDAMLLGTGVEAVARLNLLPREIVSPYLFAGAGWKRYDLTNVDVNTSDVQDTDDLLEIPMGVGVAYRFEGFVADVRGEFRAATNEDLLPRDDADAVELHRWGASARLGYEF